MAASLIVAAIVVFVALLYAGRAYWAWVAAAALLLAAWWAGGAASEATFFAVAGLGAAAALVFGVPAVRRHLVARHLMPVVRAALPSISDTERVALEAGTVWWDAELFSGRPDWSKLFDFTLTPLTERERAFLDGPVDALCRMIDDWAIHQERDLPDDVWAFLKRERFFGMIIPEEHGGLGFSAIAHAAVITKIASRSVTVATVVMVPNSLGPAELLLHYGTDAQRRHYLPRLARGEEIPCFALTEPEAGSDAAASKSVGIVCRGSFDGEEVLGIRIDWRKRYITLAPVATVIGLAFRLRDPDGLLGGDDDLGITCALVPADLPGIEIGARHDPMGVPFPNGPIVGREVFVPLDFVIGGRDGVGQGWRMLMDSLAAGRSVSLPSLSVAAVELAARAVGAYATIREQFDQPIGRFEGIEEPLARIAGAAYYMNAARILTCGAVDAGHKPAVLSAIVKAYLTEAMRDAVADAMDIQAGAALCRGARNLLARVFVGVPVAITVEGANILTRSLIVYGQGAIRCHPFLHQEMRAVETGDLARFDRALFGHLGLVASNALRAVLLAATGGRLAARGADRLTARHVGRLTRFSAAFALTSDATLATLGGALKRHQKVSGRLADALAWMYIGSAALKRFHDDGGPEGDAALLRWSCELAEWNVQEALVGVLDNLPNRAVAWLLRPLLFPFGRRARPPSDALGASVARCLLEDDPARRRLTADIFVPDDADDALGRLESALAKVVRARPVEHKLRRAVRNGTLDGGDDAGLAEAAVARGLIDDDERAVLDAARAARLDAIQVDAFDPQTYRALRG